jgi:hypothetical protein
VFAFGQLGDTLIEACVTHELPCPTR